MQFVTMVWSLPSDTWHYILRYFPCSTQRMLDSETLTKYYQHCERLHGPLGTTLIVHHISFVSRRLIYNTNSARSYTSLGRISYADLKIYDFRSTFVSLFILFSMKV